MTAPKRAEQAQAATERPWKVAACERHTVESGLPCVALRTSAGYRVPDTLANLSLMARAVNSYDAMREALLKLSNEAHSFLSMADAETHGYTNISVLRLRIKEARAALALANPEASQEQP